MPDPPLHLELGLGSGSGLGLLLLRIHPFLSLWRSVFHNLPDEVIGVIIGVITGVIAWIGC